MFVYGTRGLRAALDDQSITSILLRSRQDGPPIINMTVTPGTEGQGPSSGWGSAPGPATVAPGRNLTVAPAPVEVGGTPAAAAGTAGAVLDMRQGPAPAIIVAAGAALRFQGLTLLAAPPFDGRKENMSEGGVFPPPLTPSPFYTIPQLGLWPSIVPEPGGELGLVSTTVYAVGGCATVSACIPSAGLGAGVPRAGTQARVVPAGKGDTQLLVRAGYTDCPMPVLSEHGGSGSGKVVGKAHIYYVDSVTVCTEKDAAAAAALAQSALPSSSFPWWAGLAIGVLAAILLAAGLAGLAAARARKRGRPWCGGGAAAGPRPPRTHHPAWCACCARGGGRDAEAPPPPARPPLTAVIIAGGEDSAWGEPPLPARPTPFPSAFASVTATPPPSSSSPEPTPPPPPPQPQAPLTTPTAGRRVGEGRPDPATTAASPRPRGTIARALTPAEAVGLGELRNALTAVGHPVMVRAVYGSAATTDSRTTLASLGQPRPSGPDEVHRMASTTVGLGQPRTSASTTTAGTTTGSLSTPPISDPTDWATMAGTLATPLNTAWTALRVGAGEEELEIGALIGRGSFGRVYKGRWGSTGGALVAVKVIETSDIAAALDAAADAGGTGGEPGEDATDLANDATNLPAARAARESLLSLALAHPNVVPTYRILFVDPARRRSAEVSPQEMAGGGTQAAAALAAAALAVTAESTERASSPSPTSTQARTTSGGTARSPAAVRAAHAGDVLASLREDDGTPVPSTTPTAVAAPATGEEYEVQDAAARLATGWTPPEGTDQAGSRTATTVPPRTETWLIMEYADRGTLDDAIRGGRFHRRPWRGNGTAAPPVGSSGDSPDTPVIIVPDLIAMLRCLTDIASGMSYLHGVGIIHADLKPSNVLLKSTLADARGFICKISDFGLARLAAAATHVSTMATGTSAYQAPEALSHGRLSRPGDVYSFGILMAELWTRVSPFTGLSIGQVVYGVVYAGARPDLDPPACPPAYAALVRACWAEDPNARITFSEVLSALRGMLQEALVGARAAAAAAGEGGGGGGGGSGGPADGLGTGAGR